MQIVEATAEGKFGSEARCLSSRKVKDETPAEADVLMSTIRPLF
jgi:hypothetical protein